MDRSRALPGQRLPSRTPAGQLGGHEDLGIWDAGHIHRLPGSGVPWSPTTERRLFQYRSVTPDGWRADAASPAKWLNQEGCGVQPRQTRGDRLSSWGIRAQAPPGRSTRRNTSGTGLPRSVDRFTNAYIGKIRKVAMLMERPLPFHCRASCLSLLRATGR